MLSGDQESFEGLPEDLKLIDLVNFKYVIDNVNRRFCSSPRYILKQIYIQLRLFYSHY